MRMRQGDTLPALVIDLTDSGEALDLTTADSVRVVGVQGVTQVIDDAGPDVDAGSVTHAWVEGETDTVGRIFVNVIVDWGATQQTFPPYGSLAVDVGETEIVEEAS